MKSIGKHIRWAIMLGKRIMKAGGKPITRTPIKEKRLNIKVGGLDGIKTLTESNQAPKLYVTLGWDLEPTILKNGSVYPRSAELILHKDYYPNWPNEKWPIDPVTKEKLPIEPIIRL